MHIVPQKGQGAVTDIAFQAFKKVWQMGKYARLWWPLFAVLFVTFGLLAWNGVEVYRQALPIPSQVVMEDNAVITTQEQILDGQTAWQRTRQPNRTHYSNKEGLSIAAVNVHWVHTHADNADTNRAHADGFES